MVGFNDLNGMFPQKPKEEASDKLDPKQAKEIKEHIQKAVTMLEAAQVEDPAEYIEGCLEEMCGESEDESPVKGKQDRSALIVTLLKGKAKAEPSEEE